MNTATGLGDTGFLLGKFMPVHRGHMYLIECARSQVRRLTVLVCTLEKEPIPGGLRYRWVRDLYPDVNVQHLTDEIPSYPEEHPDFWDIWTRTIRRFVPVGPDVVFSSELYGDKLAECLGARHVCLDLQRETYPVSGTAVRANPLACWDFIPPPVQAYFAHQLSLGVK